jgi:hypothetical protein
MKKKNFSILNFNYRDDYKQVLILQEKHDNVIKECLTQNFKEIKEFKVEPQRRQIIVNNLIHKLGKKLNHVIKYAIKIHAKLEYIQISFYERIVDLAVKGHIKDPEPFFQEINNKIVPFENQLNYHLNLLKDFDKINFDHKLVALKEMVN